MKTSTENTIFLSLTYETYYEMRRMFIKEHVSSVTEQISKYESISSVVPGFIRWMLYKLLKPQVKIANEKIDEFNEIFKSAPYPIEKINF